MDQVIIVAGTVFSRNAEIMANDIGSETVMMSIDTGKYFGMNKTGAYIWKQLENPMTFKGLCEKIVTDYNIPFDKCEQEVTVFLEELLREKIIIKH